MSNPLNIISENFAKEAELTPAEWKFVRSTMQEIHLNKGDILFSEGSEADEVYFLEKGSLNVIKDQHVLAVIPAGLWVGEIAALDVDKVRTASIYAKESSTLLMLSLPKFKKATQGQPELYLKVVLILSRNMANRLRETSITTIQSIQKQLELSRTRNVMGQFLCNILLALGFFFYILKMLSISKLNPADSSYVSIPLILFLSYFIYNIMKKSGYPPSSYGFTTKNWKKATIENLWMTVGLCLFFLSLKIFVRFLFPELTSKPLFVFQTLIHAHLGFFTWFIMTFGYSLLAPVQEIMARGCLQGSLMKFLVGKHKTRFAIVLSNLIFSTLHLQLSLEVAVYSFIIGCCWGWLYARNQTLIGVSISHVLFGLWGFVILGPAFN